jgi:phasin family protein
MTSKQKSFFAANFQDFMDPDKLASSFKVPGMDPSAWTEMQRKNLETIAEANRICFEGLQAVGQRQAEIMRQAVEEAVEAVRDLADQSAPEKRAAMQVAYVKKSYEKLLSNLRELSEINVKSNSEAAEKINHRITENLDELAKVLQEPAAGGAKKK